MADDATRARRLKAMHPQQVVIVHYEDIAKHSTTAAQYIYKLVFHKFMYFSMHNDIDYTVCLSILIFYCVFMWCLESPKDQKLCFVNRLSIYKSWEVSSWSHPNIYHQPSYELNSKNKYQPTNYASPNFESIQNLISRCILASSESVVCTVVILRSILIHFAYIEVAPPWLVILWYYKLRGSNSNEGKMDQNWSKSYRIIFLRFTENWA